MLHRHFRDFCSFYARKLAECVVGALYFGKANGMGGDFVNAREVRNFFGSAVVSQADRLYGQTGLSDEDLCRLEESDFKYNERMIE